jgi:hypothetical protein
MSAFDPKRTCRVRSLEDRINHPSYSIARCCEVIAVAVSQIDGDPIVSNRLVDPALKIAVAHFKKIIALQRAGRRNPMTHKNAEDLTANVHIGRSVMHRSTIGFARHRSYACTATVDKIVQLMGNLAFVAGAGAACLLKVDTPIVLLLFSGISKPQNPQPTRNPECGGPGDERQPARDGPARLDIRNGAS